MPLPDPADRAALLDAIALACVDAGLVIMEHRANGFDVHHKPDESPVTAADHAAEKVLLEALAQLAPGVPVVAEEESAAGRVPDVDARFFLVDPLDGTREFVRKGQDFTVNVGLIEHRRPVLGVVYAPALGRLFAGAQGLGAWEARVEAGEHQLIGRRAIRVRTPGPRWEVVGSRSHKDSATERYVRSVDAGEVTNVGSSLKFGLVAAAEADLYPRAGPTSEWDTAAGDAVLRAAGGRMRAPDGSEFLYAKPDFKNGAFVASGDFDTPPIAPFL